MSPSYRETLLQVGTAIKQDGHGFIQNMKTFKTSLSQLLSGTPLLQGVVYLLLRCCPLSSNVLSDFLFLCRV